MTRQVDRNNARKEANYQSRQAKIAHRKARRANLRNRIRNREARELQSTAGYQLPLLAARTAVGRLRRFKNDNGKMVRLV